MSRGCGDGDGGVAVQNHTIPLSNVYLNGANHLRGRIMVEDDGIWFSEFQVWFERVCSQFFGLVSNGERKIALGTHQPSVVQTST